ncbi:cb680d21-7e9b-4cfb-b7be-840b4415bfcc [Sclerotinia trifoliorum]|uniref:Cb680d21-7e9b-4cfb-b7be-840b4415bfcc n=1 Tax=Sclerotinia trifoliorum TaxID=28548 RepID=A0A8H2VMX7_9HELO|nr:cb680d21-7e9b-4cfb-b7be-840b4415bfcc [Sclerotinia trifoliorum]
MFLSKFISVLLFSDLAIAWVSSEAAKSMDVETLVPVTFTTLSESDETQISSPNPPETLLSILINTSTTPSSPSTTLNFLPLSLTATLRTLSENDSKAAPTTSSSSSSTNVQISEPPLSTQALPRETGFSTPDQFKVQILQAQNWYRAAHGAKPLVWNDILADTSSEWVARCVWELESTPGIGKSFVSVIPTSVFGIINYLGLERQFYNWSDPGMNNSTKQFTQMVWKNTAQVGCAWNNCPPGSSPDPSPPASNEVALFLLCQYYPKGNQGSSQDWSNNVGELESGTLGEGVVAVDGFGLSSSTGTSGTSSTTSSSSAATGVDSQSMANKLHHGLFEAIATSALIIGLVTICPSIIVPLILAFGFADATFQVGISASFTTTHHVGAVSKPTITLIVNTQAPPVETGFSSPLQLQASMLKGVNWYRNKFDDTAIVWDESLTSDGEAWQYVIGQYYRPGNPDGISYDDQQWTGNVSGLGWEFLDDISYGIPRSSLFTDSFRTKTATKIPFNTALASTTALTTSTTVTVSSIETASIASSFVGTFFTMIISLTISFSISKHPSVLISFLLSSGLVIAMPQSDMLTTKSSKSGPAFSSTPQPGSTFLETSMPRSVSVTSVENLNALPISAERFVTIIPRPSQTTTNDITTSPIGSVTYNPYVSGQFNMPTLNTQAQPWQTGFSSPAQFKAEILWGINWYRGFFNYSNLIWNDTIAGWSTDWVHCCDWNDTLVVTDPDLGSTSFMAINVGGMSDTPGVLDVVNAWGAESVEYYSADGGPKLPTFPIGSIASDDFTQMVWNGTTQVGCGWNNCPAGSSPIFTNNLPWQFTFCQYYPQGNTGDTKAWYKNIQPVNPGIISQLIHGITSSDASFSVVSTTTILGHHSSTTIGIAHTSKNVAEKLEVSLLVVVISLVIVVAGLL